MNLLKQTALILGLASLSIAGWTLYRNWQQKTAVLYSALCFLICVWALSFVSHVTLSGRLSGDIHLLFNLWLSPLGVLVLSQMLPGRVYPSSVLLALSSFGALVLSGFIITSHTDYPYFWQIVAFWPSFIFFEYSYLFIQDIVLKKPVNVDFIPTDKRNWLYIGLGLCMLTCTFDHIPYIGFIIPSIGNLLLTAYLAVIAQVITPKKLLRLDALFSRFFATVILALVITGFFALLYQYISESFPLFLLNSFLISFAVLVLWSPLVSLFRFLGQKFIHDPSLSWDFRLQRFQLELGEVTEIQALEQLLTRKFQRWVNATETQLVLQNEFGHLPEPVAAFFSNQESPKNVPVLHRELIKMERDQLFTQQKKEELDSLIHFLDFWNCDIIFPIYSGKTLTSFIRVAAPSVTVEWTVSPVIYHKIFKSVQIVGEVIHRITQIEAQTEKERLILLGEMAAGLAHEVRNPLGAIRGAAELIDSASSPWAKVIQEEVGRLNRLVSQFLEFAHVPKEVPDHLNLNELVSTCLQNFSVSAGSQCATSKNKIECELAPEPIPVYVVPDQIQQVILNLVQNGLKAVEGNPEGRVTVRVFRSGFQVNDNGIGMNDETKKKVFQPFFTSFSKGTGLGLAICQRLVQLNAGQIRIESELNQGTQMIVNLSDQEW